MNKISIFSHTAESYAEAIFSLIGKGREHAKLLYQEWFRFGKAEGDDPHFRNAAPLLKNILDVTDFTYLPFATTPLKGVEEQTEKYLLTTSDGLEIEMVVLPMKAGYTLCISSQVGCRMGCAFCETGKMGLLRSLTTAEILSQVYQARHGLGIPVRNIVFMGMGEPLDNYEAVMKAISILTDPRAFGLGPSRITISTSGVVDKIYRLIEEADPAISLAISINAPNDQVRGRLMPVNHRFDMTALRRAMEAYNLNPRRRIFIEYILIKGKTDSLEDAQELADYLKGLKVTINLIPYNPQSRGPFLPPDPQNVILFLEALKKRGYFAFVRGTKGQRIMAACGQLGNLALKKTFLKEKKELAFSGM